MANRRQLASYVGITPMPYQSGGMDRDRSISRAGNLRARTGLIQLAWLWLRYQPGSALATWFRERAARCRVARVGSPSWRWQDGFCRALALRGDRGASGGDEIRAETTRPRRKNNRVAVSGITAGETRPSSSLVARCRRLSGGSRLAGERLVQEALWCGTA